uniref:NADH-ubiquinone oxidoreductase chain 4 n=1 Tax=Cladotaenia vulturi TaxID=1917734 RepID=A0A1J0I301_9CEST|nr:NADH dehydrogenase subunit 4 [Cladotaenia vulturi]APC62894.1 NADH dehydrogenase subunit 4 [Cladotaenia vulturi]
MSMFGLIGISWFLISLSLICFILLFSIGISNFISYSVFSGYFLFDSISFYLILLVIILGICSNVIYINEFSSLTRLLLFFSIIFSMLCFCVNHSVIFWCLYELSMLPLLCLLFMDSPYSERFLAGWYFSAYLLVTSLPLILILLYLSFINDSFFFNEWNYGSYGVFLFLSFVFFTKIPLVPFHTWLPIVHAEATSIVSIFLSGYIMKLGLLGVYRCVCCIFNCGIFYYLFICCLCSILFIVVACSELDGKRWLAFLSLSHIVVSFLGFFIGDWVGISVSFFYCLGHGLSAGIVFGLLWCFYDICNSRNWLVLKSSVSGDVLFIMVILSLLSLCSFPFTIQFFCEVNLIKYSFGVLFYILFWVLYLFFGGLVPLVLCGHLFIRSEFYDFGFNSNFYHYYFLSIISLWCYCGALFL